MKRIDLSYPLHAGMFKYPSDPEIEIIISPARTEKIAQEIWDENSTLGEASFTKYKSGCTEIKARNHHGTHVDAPGHKIPDGRTIDQYDLQKFINEAILVDLTSTNLLRREKRIITIEDIAGKVEPAKNLGTGGAVIFYTGFCDEMARAEGKLIGAEKTDFERTFPYFSQQAAEYFVKKFPMLNIAGIDSFSFDPSGSNSEVHRLFFRKNILLLETLTNLAELKKAAGTRMFKLNCIPIKYRGADASPTSAYAIV